MSEPGYPSLVGGRPAKSVARMGLVGSNPTPGASPFGPNPFRLINLTDPTLYGQR